MGVTSTIRIVLNILIAIFMMGFLLALLWFFNGSMEMVPTAEQEAKARIGAAILMALMGIGGMVCVTIRVLLRKNKR